MSDLSSRSLDPKLSSLISELRGRIRRYIALDALLAGAAVILIAFWIGLLVDYGPVKLGGTEMPRSARGFLLLATIIGVAVVFIRLFWGRFTTKLPDESLALLLERHHPELGGRLITVVQLNRPRQAGDLYAPGLLDRVHQEATHSIEEVDTRRVLRQQPLLSKTAIVIPLLLAFVGLAIASPNTLKQAVARLSLVSDQAWPRQADLRMVGLEVPLVSAIELNDEASARVLEFTDKTVRVAKGVAATLRIEARAEGAVVPEVCTMYYRSESGLRGQVNMRRVGRVRDGYQSFAIDGPPLAGISEDLTVSIRGMDDRLDEYHIQAVEPPSITKLEVQSRYPDYLRSEELAGPDLVTRYQPGLRLREGSTATLVGVSGTPVARVDAAITSGDGVTKAVAVDVAEDGLSFQLSMADVRQPTTIVLVPLDANEISAPSPYRYFLGVVSDAPPEASLRLKGIGSAVTPDVRLPLNGTAKDDYGITKITVQLNSVGESARLIHAIEVDANRDGEFSGELDIRDLSNAGTIERPKAGDQWNLFAEAQDGYDLGDPHVTRTELMRIDVVTPEDLLAALERRELGLRARLELIIGEVEGLRTSLDLIQREGWRPGTATTFRWNNPNVPSLVASLMPKAALTASVLTGQVDADVDPVQNAEPETDRDVQLLRLRIQQAGLQTAKTSEELTGVAEGLDEILMEMQNNRVDTPDRAQRIATAVRDPIRAVVNQPLDDLERHIEEMLSLAENAQDGPQTAALAVQDAEQVLLQLNAILEKMLDLESYNEVLDLVRGLIDSQGELIEATEEERKRAIQDLFRD